MLFRSLRFLHNRMAVWVNRLDGSIDRKVWHNYWETRLTNQRSYLARLKYVHENAVKHGLVEVAWEYPWCSAAFFERSVSPAIRNAINRFKVDRISIEDEFEVSKDW